MARLVRSVLSGPGRIVNKAFDAVGLGPNNTIRNLSGSSRMATALHDENKPLTANQIINPSGEGTVFDPAGGFAPTSPRVPEAAKVIPMPDTEGIAKSRRRASQGRLNRGRASTILGNDAETLG